MVRDGSQPHRPFNASNREDLSDARLLLETAVHNIQACLRNPDPDEAHCALEAALTMASQALAALQRVRAASA
jgi:hypothetical protein